MTYHHAIRLLSVTALATLLAACGEQQSSVPATEFNQKLTDTARRVSSLPENVEKLQCWAKKPVLGSDEAFCNVFFRGRAVKDVGQSAIGWGIPVRSRNPFEDDRAISPYELDIPILARARFFLVANNGPQGLSVEVAADRNLLPLSKAEEFVDIVLPVVSKEMSAKLACARDAAPDSVRATWSSKLGNHGTPDGEKVSRWLHCALGSPMTKHLPYNR
ncbi:hypothetical protein [Cupriavidus sp. UYPR2.512]|uniref:hypothetical protein n=1 Tax=Cupriavidus sp. UYPR2.512 TaxID=1080187 RepID=UPI0018DFAE59|nr:hypothetical protein [Cupriavidus sp. UYPR2.512]UIF89296.1 hypothetical protein KAF44_30485 [Cupriavidus necator]